MYVGSVRAGALHGHPIHTTPAGKCVLNFSRIRGEEALQTKTSPHYGTTNCMFVVPVHSRALNLYTSLLPTLDSMYGLSKCATPTHLLPCCVFAACLL